MYITYSVGPPGIADFHILREKTGTDAFSKLVICYTPDSFQSALQPSRSPVLFFLFDNYKHHYHDKNSLGACNQLQCEVCGHRIHGKPYKVVIEGARMTVCDACSKHGKLVWEEEPKPKPITLKTKAQPIFKVQSKKPEEPPVETSVELVEGFAMKIRQAREKLGLSHEDLGKKLNEKVSLLRKIETGKMTPDNMLSAKLERVLKIKFIVPTSQEKGKTPLATVPKKMNAERTLGDLIQLSKKKGKEDMAEREPS